jgi:hypothetical protein
VIGAALGDSLAQASTHYARESRGEGPAVFKWDAARTARLCLHTALVSTPISHTWFGFLDRASSCGGPTGGGPRCRGGPAQAAGLAEQRALRRSTFALASDRLSLCSTRAPQSVFPTRMSHPVTALAKVALDQALMSPLALTLVSTRAGPVAGRAARLRGS